MSQKSDLLKVFQKDPKKYWDVEMFKREGFVRKVCRTCSKGFWTLDESRDHCPDSKCGEEYTFIRNSPAKKKLDYIETWKMFERFFEKNGHASIPRYPVISRWREDLFFNIASIVDFQRFDNGVMTFDYPENPLVVPQMCLRFNDIPNVGVTGRHHTCFMMPGQHAFNPPKEGYWKDKCIDLNYEFFTKEMKVDKEKLVYVEELWAMPDFSALGPYIETFSGGLELVNSGFMEFTLSNGQMKPLPMKVIDVGWGLERLVWLSNATSTGYDVVFGPVIQKMKDAIGFDFDNELFSRYSKMAGVLDVDDTPDLLKARKAIASKLGVTVDELEKNVAPMEAIYAIADHSRALLFSLSDGGMPSNVGGGYNLRVILRRAMDFIQKNNLKIRLDEVAGWHADYLKKLFPELQNNLDDFSKIVRVEERKYKENRERVKRIVQALQGKELSEEELIKKYDSEGITPEQLGLPTPPDFYSKVTATHMGKKKEEERAPMDVVGVTATEILYYKEPRIFHFDATVIKSSDGFVVLDRTAFYPTSGGQLHDTGKIGEFDVKEVTKIGNVIIHKISGSLKKGDIVKCAVDQDRRTKLMRHHDAVHIVNGATKKVLGNHVNQAGAEKDVDKARLDITHYESLTDEQIGKIEDTANNIVEDDLPVQKHVMTRSEAERKYGFRIYQGGYVPSKEIRIVEITNFDIEACGGTHGDSTGEVGRIKIVKTKKIADGLVRLELKAGDVAESYMKEKAEILGKVAGMLGVKESDVPDAVSRLFDKWKSLRKGRK